MTTVSICMLTYKRPALLQKALDSLALLRCEKNPDVQIDIVVVDNDGEGSGRTIVTAKAGTYPFPLKYVIEPEQGIAHARNRALTEGAHADFLAFIDDDEVAEKDWIDELVTAQRRFQADVVSGPVMPAFENAPDWILKGSFFAKRNENNGATITFVETNNVLLRSDFARKYKFDLRFNKTSGEDTHFFLQLQRDGAKMVWAEHALVHEFIPQQRTSAAWLIDRAQSDANRYTRARLYLEPNLRMRVKRIGKAIGAFSAGCTMFLLSLFSGTHKKVHARRMISRGLGTTKALFGSAHLYYVPGKPLR